MANKHQRNLKRKVSVNSWAKINLLLKIVGKYPDNFHKIETIFSLIDLSDLLTFQLTENGIVNVLTNIGYLNGRNNICFDVAHYLKTEFKPSYGIDLFIDKKIPISAGLGGGSSNAAMTILVLNDLWNLELSSDSLNNIAAKFGSDINFFLSGFNTAIGTGRGEIIEPVRDFYWDNILLVNPGIEISAKDGYAYFKESNNLPQSYDSEHQVESFYNDLEPGVRTRFRVIDSLLVELEKYGAIKAMMSGSGSTCIGFFNNKVTMNEAAKRFNENGFWTYQTKTRSGIKECIQG